MKLINCKEQIELELSRIIANLEQTIDALEGESYRQEAALVRSHVEQLKNRDFLLKVKGELDRDSSCATCLVDKAVYKLARSFEN